MVEYHIPINGKMSPEEHHNQYATGFSALLSQLDFSRIDDEIVGYSLFPLPEESIDDLKRLHTLKPITFREFIAPYVNASSSMQDILYNLSNDLESAVNRCKVNQLVEAEHVAEMTLSREARLRARDLIRKNYEVKE